MGVVRIEDLPRYTYEDYLLWEGDWELISGIAYAMSPAPVIAHQEIVSQIITQFNNKIKECKDCKVLPDIDWKINKDTVVRPDILVACDIDTKGANIQIAPLIIFEVLSPSTKLKDRNLKYRLYQDNGVKYYILVEPTGAFAEVYELEDDIYRLKGEFKDESFVFDIDRCKIDFSFKEVFELF